MFADIIAILVVIILVSHFIKGGHMDSFLKFFGLVRESARKQGVRGTTHAVIDGIFNNADNITKAIKSGASKTQEKVQGLKAQDYEYDASRRELTIFLSRTQDMVLEAVDGGGFKAFLINLDGKEIELDKRAFERQINMLSRKGKLSDSQAKAMKDFMAMGRRTRPSEERTTRIPRNRR